MVKMARSSNGLRDLLAILFIVLSMEGKAQDCLKIYKGHVRKLASLITHGRENLAKNVKGKDLQSMPGIKFKVNLLYKFEDEYQRSHATLSFFKEVQHLLEGKKKGEEHFTIPYKIVVASTGEEADPYEVALIIQKSLMNNFFCATYRGPGQYPSGLLDLHSILLEHGLGHWKWKNEEEDERRRREADLIDGLLKEENVGLKCMGPPDSSPLTGPQLKDMNNGQEMIMESGKEELIKYYRVIGI